MINWSRCAALTVAMALGFAANAQAAVATFIFRDETGTGATGTLVLKDYVPGGGTFVSWNYSALTGPYAVNSADLVNFSSNLDISIVPSVEQNHEVTIESSTFLFKTGIDDPNDNSVALLWKLSCVSVPGDPPCGGGDGPQIDNSPPFTYTWQLASLAVPEPMTWVLMIGGFGAVGAQLRTRRRRMA